MINFPDSPVDQDEFTDPNGAVWVWSDVPGAWDRKTIPRTFDALTDTPANKTGAEGKFPRVSGGNLVYDTPVTGRKNVLINGNMTINQRGFDGNWAGLADGDYGFDRWRKNGADIEQVIEAGSFETNVEHTLSGTNVVTSQITSPAAGDWTITVPNTATKIQLERGSHATDFEYINPAEQLAMCQRYYRQDNVGLYKYRETESHKYSTSPIAMRVTPAITLSNIIGATVVTTGGTTATTLRLSTADAPAGQTTQVEAAADAEF